MIDSRFAKVLHQLYNHLNIDEINWAVTGSLGFALQGMDVDVHDIDIQTDKSGAYEIERRFSQYVVRNVGFSSSEKIRSHFGELSIDGLSIPVMSLEYECEAYYKLGRVEKAEQIKRYLERQLDGAGRDI